MRSVSPATSKGSFCIIIWLSIDYRPLHRPPANNGQCARKSKQRTAASIHPRQQLLCQCDRRCSKGWKIRPAQDLALNCRFSLEVTKMAVRIRFRCSDKNLQKSLNRRTARNGWAAPNLSGQLFTLARINCKRVHD